MNKIGFPSSWWNPWRQKDTLLKLPLMAPVFVMRNYIKEEKITYLPCGYTETSYFSDHCHVDEYMAFKLQILCSWYQHSLRCSFVATQTKKEKPSWLSDLKGVCDRRISCHPNHSKSVVISKDHRLPPSDDELSGWHGGFDILSAKPIRKYHIIEFIFPSPECPMWTRALRTGSSHLLAMSAPLYTHGSSGAENGKKIGPFISLILPHLHTMKSNLNPFLSRKMWSFLWNNLFFR